MKCLKLKRNLKCVQLRELHAGASGESGSEGAGVATSEIIIASNTESEAEMRKDED